VYNQAIKEKLSHEEAMEKAAEIVNFRRISGDPRLQFASRVIPFFNAYLQVKTDKGLAPSTNNKHIALFVRMINVAFQKKKVGYEAVVESKILEKSEENNSRINSLTPELMNLLLEEVEKKSLQKRQFMEFAFACGIRKNRVYSLTWDMIDLVEKEIDIPQDKHGKQFKADLGPTAVRVLTDRLYDTRKDQPHRYVFSNPQTNTCWVDLKNAFNDARDNAISEAFNLKINPKGLVDFKFHDARHTFISSLVNAKVPFDQVQKLAGHLDARSTERYTHRDKTLMKEAVAKLPY
ncbi:MAG: site-specific integrase, partial [Desulfuromonadales bacterium]